MGGFVSGVVPRAGEREEVEESKKGSEEKKGSSDVSSTKTRTNASEIIIQIDVERERVRGGRKRVRGGRLIPNEGTK